jgi:hypothetical protein
MESMDSILPIPLDLVKNPLNRTNSSPERSMPSLSGTESYPTRSSSVISPIRAQTLETVDDPKRQLIVSCLVNIVQG